MKIITYFILFINLIFFILSKNKKRSKNSSNALSKSKTKKGFFLRRPFGYYRGLYSGLYRPTYTFFRRTPLIYSSPLLVPLSNFATCPMNKGRKALIGKGSSNCKPPCNPENCIQLRFECCIYGFSN